jgi:hypothetical protein
MVRKSGRMIGSPKDWLHGYSLCKKDNLPTQQQTGGPIKARTEKSQPFLCLPFLSKVILDKVYYSQGASHICDLVFIRVHSYHTLTILFI